MREGNSVLVTGGAGFLGSHLCERLLRERRDVVCVDNCCTGTRRNVEHLFGYRNFELLRHDVTFPLYVETDQIDNLSLFGQPGPLPARPGSLSKARPLGRQPE